MIFPISSTTTIRSPSPSKAIPSLRPSLTPFLSTRSYSLEQLGRVRDLEIVHPSQRRVPSHATDFKNAESHMELQQLKYGVAAMAPNPQRMAIHDESPAAHNIPIRKIKSSKYGAV
jgi:hypothetical protein